MVSLYNWIQKSAGPPVRANTRPLLEFAGQYGTFIKKGWQESNWDDNANDRYIEKNLKQIDTKYLEAQAFQHPFVLQQLRGVLPHGVDPPVRNLGGVCVVVPAHPLCNHTRVTRLSERLEQLPTHHTGK